MMPNASDVKDHKKYTQLEKVVALKLSNYIYDKYATDRIKR